MNIRAGSTGFRALVFLALLAAMIFGVGLTGAAARSALPGDTLYSLKGTLEQTRLSLARDAGERVQLRLAFAEKRLEEIQALIDEGRFSEIDGTVLAFEADLHTAILEVETLARLDPARGARLALEITSALSRFARILTSMPAGLPQSVRDDMARALDTTLIASGLELPSSAALTDDNSNGNVNDNSNSNTNDVSNVNGDDSSNVNGNGNSNVNGDDSSNINGDDGSNTNDDGGSNTNDDGGSNSNDDHGSNDNGDDSSGRGKGGGNSNDD